MTAKEFLLREHLANREWGIRIIAAERGGGFTPMDKMHLTDFPDQFREAVNENEYLIVAMLLFVYGQRVKGVSYYEEI